MYRNYRKRMNRLNKSVHSLNEKFKGIENDFNEIQKENRQIKKHLKNKLFPKIENLENSLSELKKRKRVELKNNTTDRKETGKVKISSPDEVQNIKYFSAPDENGRFDNKRALDTPQGRVYYSISYAADSKTGVIDYHQGKLDQSAIDQRDSILKPVCKIRNSEISNPIKINQIKSGEAELVNGIWKINEKIQIEFQ